MERLAYSIYSIILIISILLFGAMHTYVYTLMYLGVLTATVLLVIKAVRKDHKLGTYQVRFLKTGLSIAFLVLLAFLVFQITPLSGSILTFLSSEAGRAWEMSLPAAALAEGTAETGLWATIAPYVYPVRMSIVRFTVYALFFLGLIQVLNSQRRIEILIALILVMGCFEALYGLIQAYSGSPHVLWFKSLAGRNAKGTYINRNHFAGLMSMGMLLAAAYTASLSERRRPSANGGRKSIGFRVRLTHFLSGEQHLNKRILILFSGVVMGIGLVFSASRAGIASATGALLCMSLFFVFRKHQRRTGVIFLALSLIVSVYALNIGVDYVVGRFGRIDSDFEERSRFSKKAFEMFEDYRLLGVGVGNFKYAYPKYQAVEDKKKFIRFAHNDWAQFLSEAGVTGMILLLGAMAYYFIHTFRVWRRRRDPFAVCLGVTPYAALTAIGIHSYSDFNLHIPANFLVLLAIMAIGYAAIHLERHHRRDKMTCRYYTLPLKYRGGVFLVLMLGLVVWSGYWTIRHFVAEVYCNTVPNSTLNRDKNPPVEEIVKAIEWDPGNAQYWYKLGNRQMSEARDQKKEGIGQRAERRRKEAEIVRELAGERRLLTSDFRLPALEKAVELNPFDAQSHLLLGWQYARLWKKPDYHTNWLPAADISMDRAAYFAGVKNPYLHQELGNYWTMRSKSVLPDNPLHHEAWTKATQHYLEAQYLEAGDVLKRMKKEIREYVWNFYPDEAYVAQVIVAGKSN
jgi:O-antigen ligase